MKWLAGLALAVSLGARADCAKDPECDSLSPWMELTAFSLDYSIAGSPGRAIWKGELDSKANDILVRIDTQGWGEPMKGDIAMVSGRVMLSRGLDLKPGYEIDSLDGPVLTLRIVMNTMGRVFPKGPASISGEQAFDKTFTVGMKFATPSADGYIAAPWTAKGKASRQRDGAIAYDLTIISPTGHGKETSAMKLSGELSKLDRPVFSDGMSLEGWKTYGVGVQVETQGKSTTYDYGARADTSTNYKTIGDIRAYVAKKVADEQYPGVRDSTKDFTGFWKGKCDEGFGLKVVHQGDEGKYAVVFCGPGGCGDVAAERLTYITGDKHYQVVSDDEFVFADTHYRRCSRDPDIRLK